MTLETALTYLVAVAVPVWLLVEQILSWRQAKERKAQAASAAVSEAASVRKAPAATPPGAIAVDFPRRAA
jgi:hypothetical protein